jgi:hypothetical protein
MLVYIIAVAAVIDSFAAGLWVGHKWGSAAVNSALDRAVTFPAGGLKTVAAEVADEVTAVATKVSEVGTAVSGAVQATADVHAKVNNLLQAQAATAPK